jgi:TonB family protein
MGKSQAAIVLCSIATVLIFAQEKSHGNVSVVKLFPPVYPPLAKQARIAGDVQLTLAVRPDGSINSATVVSDHPLLKQAALDSAQHSQFACEKCGDEELKLVYSFQLGPAVYCAGTSDRQDSGKEEEPYPPITQTADHITVVDEPTGPCHPAAKKVRAIKCLYLWKCGWREEPLNGTH